MFPFHVFGLCSLSFTLTCIDTLTLAILSSSFTQRICHLFPFFPNVVPQEEKTDDTPPEGEKEEDGTAPEQQEENGDQPAGEETTDEASQEQEAADADGKEEKEEETEKETEEEVEKSDAETEKVRNFMSKLISIRLKSALIHIKNNFESD